MSMKDDKVFTPINDLFDKLVESAKRCKGDQDMIATTIKIGLMEAYQRGQNETLDKVKSWL